MVDSSLVSSALTEMPVPDFADVVVVALPSGLGPLVADPARWARAIFSPAAAPVWVKALFALRGGLVGLIGVRCAPSDGFEVAEVAGGEALIRADDRHLAFRCGVAVDHERRLLRVTTAVRLHGWRGRCCFAPGLGAARTPHAGHGVGCGVPGCGCPVSPRLVATAAARTVATVAARWGATLP